MPKTQYIFGEEKFCITQMPRQGPLPSLRSRCLRDIAHEGPLTHPQWLAVAVAAAAAAVVAVAPHCSQERRRRRWWWRWRRRRRHKHRYQHQYQCQCLLKAMTCTPFKCCGRLGKPISYRHLRRVRTPNSIDVTLAITARLASVRYPAILYIASGGISDP